MGTPLFASSVIAIRAVVMPPKNVVAKRGRSAAAVPVLSNECRF
jgi:hypothetical protein